MTAEYTADLVYHIETLAVVGFTKMHETYCDRSSPQALLKTKRNFFHGLFIAEMGQGDMATDFCDNVLFSIILKNIGTLISNTELLHELRVHCGEMFRDIKSVQASIMVDLFKKNRGSCTPVFELQSSETVFEFRKLSFAVGHCRLPFRQWPATADKAIGSGLRRNSVF